MKSVVMLTVKFSGRGENRSRGRGTGWTRRGGRGRRGRERRSD